MQIFSSKKGAKTLFYLSFFKFAESGQIETAFIFDVSWKRASGTPAGLKSFLEL